MSTASRDLRLPFVAPIRPRNLLWIGVLGGIWVAADHYGTPHLRLSYVWSGRETAPFYHSCEYWGRHPFHVAPRNGACPLIVLARPERGG